MTTNKATETARATLLIAGANKHFANVTSLTYASAAHTPAEIIKGLQTLVDLRSAVDVAKSVVKAKLAVESAQTPTLRSQMAAFESFVKLTFSESPDVLADFGLQPKKAPTPLTTEQQAVAVAKREATRKARGTTGPKQKKSVKGAVVGVVVTPVVASPPAASSADPSATAHGGSATAGSTSHGA